MELEVGAIVEGTVSSITKFGAFVSLPEGKSGLVHISEIAHSYVSDVAEHLTVGQKVRVKVIKIDENRRINLSIKQAAPPRAPSAPASPTFEDRLKQFMQDSESKMSDLKLHMDNRRGSSRRR